MHLLEFTRTPGAYFTALEEAPALKENRQSLEEQGLSTQPLGRTGPYFFGPPDQYERVNAWLSDHPEYKRRHVVAAEPLVAAVTDAVHGIKGKEKVLQRSHEVVLVGLQKRPEMNDTQYSHTSYGVASFV